MDFSMLVAKALAVYLIISGIFLILRQKTLVTLLKDFFVHPAIVYLSGTLLVFLGLLLVLWQNQWAEAVRVWITVFGLAILSKGLLYIFAPQSLANLHIEKSKPLVALGGAVAIAIGVYLFRLN